MTAARIQALGRPSPLGLALALGGLVLLLGLVSLAVGRTILPPARLAAALAGNDDALAVVVWQLRLPRTVLALLVGASLGLSGAVLQGLLRNPLAEPGIIGISATAGLGAVIAFYTGLAGSFALALPLGGVLGAVLAVALLSALAGRAPGSLTLILAGIALNSMAGALTALALNLSPNPFAAYEIVFWLMGSLADRSVEHVGMATALMVPGWLILARLGRPLDALSLGDDAAESLGVDLVSLRWQAVLGTALAVGAGVAVCGVIGFVGLVVPHLLRPLVGHAPGRLLGVSALGGAALVLATDILVRLLSSGVEMKIGVFTAILGAPFFLWLLIRMRRALP